MKCAAAALSSAADALQFEVIFTVALFGRVSTPPGPNVMVPVELNTVPFTVPAGFVTLTVTISVCGGLAPFFVEPPRAAVVTWMDPPTVLTGAAAQGTATPPVGVKVQTNTP